MKTTYKVIWRGECHGEHQTKALAEKRIGRLVAMSNGKVKREEFKIEECRK
jgi:hypothetical protein